MACATPAHQPRAHEMRMQWIEHVLQDIDDVSSPHGLPQKPAAPRFHGSDPGRGRSRSVVPATRPRSRRRVRSRRRCARGCRAGAPRAARRGAPAAVPARRNASRDRDIAACHRCSVPWTVAHAGAGSGPGKRRHGGRPDAPARWAVREALTRTGARPTLRDKETANQRLRRCPGQGFITGTFRMTGTPMQRRTLPSARTAWRRARGRWSMIATLYSMAGRPPRWRLKSATPALRLIRSSCRIASCSTRAARRRYRPSFSGQGGVVADDGRGQQIAHAPQATRTPCSTPRGSRRPCR